MLMEASTNMKIHESKKGEDIKYIRWIYQKISTACTYKKKLTIMPM